VRINGLTDEGRKMIEKAFGLSLAVAACQNGVFEKSIVAQFLAIFGEDAFHIAAVYVLNFSVLYTITIRSLEKKQFNFTENWLKASSEYRICRMLFLW
jgi:hypothetical protein